MSVWYLDLDDEITDAVARLRAAKDGKDNHTTEVVLDRFTSRFQVLSGARTSEEAAGGAETNQPVFDKRFAFDELPF